MPDQALELRNATRSASDSARRRSGSHAWYVLGMLVLATVLSYTDRQILNLLVDPIRAEFGISDTQVSLLQGAAFAVIYAVAGLPCGWMADRFNRRNLIAAGVLIWSVATAACGLAEGFGQLFAARIAVGIGEAALAPAAVSLVCDYFSSEQRGRAIGVLLMGMMAGAGAAIVIGGVLLDLLQQGMLAFVPWLGALPPWRSLLILLGLPGVLVAALMLTVAEPSRASSDERPALSPGQMLGYFAKHRAALIPLYVALALLTVCDYAIFAWMPSVLFRGFELGPAAVGSYLGSIAILSGAGGVLAGGALADYLQKTGRTAARMGAAVLCASSAIPLLLFLFMRDLTALLAVLAMFYFCLSAGSGAGIIAVQDAVPADMRGTATSLISFCNTIVGLGLGPTLVALFTDHVFGDPSAVHRSIAAVVIPVCIMGTALLWLGRRAYAATIAALRSEPTPGLSPVRPSSRSADRAHPR